MKIKKKAAITAAVFAAAMNLSACAYGPPPESDFPDHSNDIPTAESNDFDPGDNVHYNVYGPPDGEWEDETTEESVAVESFDPADNVNYDVYGPPFTDLVDGIKAEESGADESPDMTVDTNENPEVNTDE